MQGRLPGEVNTEFLKIVDEYFHISLEIKWRTLQEGFENNASDIQRSKIGIE